MAFIAFGFYFYEGEIGLNVWITGLAYIIFAIWNAVNDPLVGWLTDRPFKFTKKWGRRFPWTMIGGVPWVFSYILIFIPPAIDPKAGAWIIFAWLVFSTCLFDTFNSIWWVNFYSLFPDKFRSSKERRIASGFITPVGIIGISLGGLVPPLLIEYGIPSTFVIQAVAVTFIAFIMLMLGIPGWRDDQECVDKYLARREEETERTPFFKALLQSFKHRSYVAFLVLYFTWQVLIFCIQATIPYLVNFVLKLKASNQLFMQIAFLVGALASIYFWIKFAQKTNNNKKVLLIASIMLAAFSIPLSFINNIWAFVVIFIFWGCALG
ncbi:MAG: MFS transporter, partial [Promethearchaeota archaeon]